MNLSLIGYLLPLFLDIVPQQYRQGVINNLMNDIVSVHQTHLTTGILGTKYLMEVLSLLGRDELALELVSLIPLN
jgi:alpha-L-rhamnosidase